MSNRTAIVTGGAQRIGAAITRELHRMGLDVIIHFHNSGVAAKALADELNALRSGSAHIIKADLARDGSARALVEQARSVNQRLDVLVNNAAVFYPTPVTGLDDSVWEEVLNVNLKAPLFLSRAAAASLAQTSGCIINMTDVYAERPLKNYSLYSISKAGLIMLTRSLARELGPAIRVNAISPGAIMWPDTLSEENRNKVLARTVMKRPGTPEDVARALHYLVADADYTTGQVLVIDGGRSLYP